LGNREAAEQCLRSARDVFHAIGYRWRESLADEALREITATKIPLSVLTPREREVFDLICDAMPLAKIADILHIANKTAESYKDRILSKLGVKSQRDLARVYRAERISHARVKNEKLRVLPSKTQASSA